MTAEFALRLGQAHAPPTAVYLGGGDGGAYSQGDWLARLGVEAPGGKA
jgi:hypothetical protein